MIDTGKMGLWPGGTFLLHGEGKWGDGIDQMVGTLGPVNHFYSIAFGGKGAIPGRDKDSCDVPAPTEAEPRDSLTRTPWLRNHPEE